MTRSTRRRHPPKAPGPGQPLVISGATVMTMDEEHRVATLDVRIEDGRIAELSERLSTRNVGHVIDGRGRVLLPGFAQTHVHLCHTLLRGTTEGMDLLAWQRERIWPLEGALHPEDLRAAARLGLAELLLGGTTAVLDVGTVRHTEVLFEEAERFGLRYAGGKAVMDHGHGYPAVLRETTEDAVAESVRLCEQFHRTAGGRLRYAFSPRSALLATDQAIGELARAARERGALLQIHAAEDAEEVALLRERTQRGNIEHLHALGATGAGVVLAHCVWLSAEERRILRETGTKVAHCPTSNLRLGSGVARVVGLVGDGVTVGLGANSAAATDRLDMFAEMRLAALLHKIRDGGQAVSARAALRMATSEGARVLGLPDCGTIQVGKHADVVLLDGDRPHLRPRSGDLATRLVFAAQSADVHTVIVDGVVRVADHRLVDLDEPAILREAELATERLRARMS